MSSLFGFTGSKSIGVYLDYSNMHYTKYTLGWEYDISGFFKHCIANDTIAKVAMYGAYDPKNITQFNRTKKLQIQYRSPKSHFYFKRLEKKGGANKGNVDTEMGYDIAEDKDSWDTLVLFTGDGDFLYIINKLIHAGKQIVLVSTKGHIAKELIDFIAQQDDKICRFVDIHKDNAITLPIKDVLKSNNRSICLPPELYKWLQTADKVQIKVLYEWVKAILAYQAITLPVFLETIQKRNQRTIASTILRRNESEKLRLLEYLQELLV